MSLAGISHKVFVAELDVEAKEMKDGEVMDGGLDGTAEGVEEAAEDVDVSTNVGMTGMERDAEEACGVGFGGELVEDEGLSDVRLSCEVKDSLVRESSVTVVKRVRWRVVVVCRVNSTR